MIIQGIVNSPFSALGAEVSALEFVDCWCGKNGKNAQSRRETEDIPGRSIWQG
jgi:hypothetical protein